MGVLTARRAKPALPFAGNYSLVDFPLSNLRNTGIDDVWLCLQYQADTLHDAVANGRPWDLDRTIGGLRLVFPQQEGLGKDENDDGFATGNADQLFRIRDDIASANPDVIVVMSADHVYAFDYDEAIAAHLDADAECTTVTTKTTLEEAAAHATVTANKSGKVTDFAYKPDKASTPVIATEVFVYRPDVLLEALDELERKLSKDQPEGDTGLGDFGEHLIPWFVKRGKTIAYPMPGYWMDVGRPEVYFQAHRDLIEGKVDVFDADWPIVTSQTPRPPAVISNGRGIEQSWISGGCRIEGVVRRSVLGPGVVVEKGATVTDSIIFADTVVRSGAKVSYSIVDSGVTIGENASVGGRATEQPVPTEQITLVGEDATITKGAKVRRGQQVDPSSRVLAD
ncbi:glucose-1-phosphate adenylyltransferase family protein [Epidermidibacterium keratini]